jgi:hypothetical protein
VSGVQRCIGGLGADSFGQFDEPQARDNREHIVLAALQASSDAGNA